MKTRYHYQRKVTSSFKKGVSLATQSAKHLVENSLNNCLFATLTFQNNVQSYSDIEEIKSSFLQYLSRNDFDNIWVYGGNLGNTFHIHLLIVVKDDVRTGSKLRLIKKTHCKEARYAAMSRTAKEWCDRLSQIAESHGFGITEFSPVYSNSIGVSRYLAKNLIQSAPLPVNDKRSARSWGCSQAVKLGNCKFSFVEGRSAYFRTVFAHAKMKEIGATSHDHAIQIHGNTLWEDKISEIFSQPGDWPLLEEAEAQLLEELDCSCKEDAIVKLGSQILAVFWRDLFFNN